MDLRPAGLMSVGRFTIGIGLDFCSAMLTALLTATENLVLTETDLGSDVPREPQSSSRLLQNTTETCMSTRKQSFEYVPRRVANSCFSNKMCSFSCCGERCAQKNEWVFALVRETKRNTKLQAPRLKV